MAETEQEIAYLESVLFQMEEAGDAEELGEIREELEEERISGSVQKAKIGEGEKRNVPAGPPIPVSEGLEIFCGKHNIGNEYLLRKIGPRE